MVTVVTIKTAAGTVSKIPSQSSQPSHSPAFPVPIGRSADREMVSQGEIAPWLWVAAVQHRMCGDDGTHAAVDDTVYRRLWPRLPQEPHPPRRAHGTLQPQDESVIVGYYTSAEVFPRNLCFQKSKFRRYFAYGKRRRY